MEIIYDLLAIIFGFVLHWSIVIRVVIELFR